MGSLKQLSSLSYVLFFQGLFSFLKHTLGNRIQDLPKLGKQQLIPHRNVSSARVTICGPTPLRNP